MIIWLSGPTGAGRTSISQLLRTFGCSVVEERAPENLFRAFKQDPKGNCEELQRHLMQSRAKRWRELRSSTCLAFDRSIDEDLEVFCRMHVFAGLLTSRQFEDLAKLATTLQAEIPPPDLILFLPAESDVLSRRIQHGGAPKVIV